MLDNVLRDLDLEDAGPLTGSFVLHEENIDKPVAPEAREMQIPQDPLRNTEIADTIVDTEALPLSNPLIMGDDPGIYSTSDPKDSELGIVLGKSLQDVQETHAESSRRQPLTAIPSGITNRQVSPPRPSIPEPPATTQPSRPVTGKENLELQYMEKRQQQEKRSPAVPKSRGKSGSKEEHGGGCRCILM